MIVIGVDALAIEIVGRYYMWPFVNMFVDVLVDLISKTFIDFTFDFDLDFTISGWATHKHV